MSWQQPTLAPLDLQKEHRSLDPLLRACPTFCREPSTSSYTSEDHKAQFTCTQPASETQSKGTGDDKGESRNMRALACRSVQCMPGGRGLVLVDFDLGHSTTCLVVLGQMGVKLNWLCRWATWWNIQINVNSTQVHDHQAHPGETLKGPPTTRNPVLQSSN